ncbi:metal ABC transporter substrate-binding protein [Paractinoplanes toevensis]|uniref:ABC transporter substrate-binding protein n=1 Tax=Paractinoplanes toevensis TaxID=571911 RepID=A0A919TAQ9_9ACTN|nr:metal ABC transporter substrate-binding protein [Actinoplanes toevensis]GIM92198.1 ABC transporter substrate-binding protein [Actinoplanes toevensis]
MTRLRYGVAAAALAVAGLLTGCSAEPAGNAAAASSEPVPVVATTPQVADFVRNIGGDDVTVTQIVKPGVDPHDYEPTPADMQAVAGAKLVVKNGVGLEKWLDRTISSAGYTGTVVDASANVALRPDDPHIWHNPLNAKIMVADIEKGLAAADPARTAVFAENLADYSAELDELDADNLAAYARIPADQRKLVTNHDAFGYYVDRYRLDFVGSVIPSMDTSAELSAKQLTDLVAKIRATGTKAVFTESSLPPKTAEAIAAQAGVKVVASLYGDSLGPAGSDGATYLTAERHNTATIAGALAG